MKTTKKQDHILNQHGLSIWIIGLSGAGKTTLASALQEKLSKQFYFSVVQDADIVRTGLNRGLGYSLSDRKENIRRAAEVSRLLVENGIISINAFICPLETFRNEVFEIIGRNKVYLVYLSTPINICEQRDVKGMYAKARKGELNNFTGVGSDFEVPKDYNLTIDTSILNISECVELIYNQLEGHIRK